MVLAPVTGAGCAMGGKPLVGSTACTTSSKTTRGLEDRLLACRRRLAVDSCGWDGQNTVPEPTDGVRPGSQHHLAIDANSTGIIARDGPTNSDSRISGLAKA